MPPPDAYRYASTKGRTSQKRNASFPIYWMDSRAFQFVIRIDWIRYANRFESIRFVKKLAFRFTSCHAVYALNK